MSREHHARVQIMELLRKHEPSLKKSGNKIYFNSKHFSLFVTILIACIVLCIFCYRHFIVSNKFSTNKYEAIHITNANLILQYFKDSKEVAIKVIRPSEINANKARQHEFYGTAPLQQIFGSAERKYDATLLIVDNSGIIKRDVNLTWYINDKIRNTYRLYYNIDTITAFSQGGDLLMAIKTNQDKIILIVIARGCHYQKLAFQYLNIDLTSITKGGIHILTKSL